MSFPPSALSADDGAVLQKLMLARPGKSWISDNEQWFIVAADQVTK